jgi:hypothetical protein
MRIDEVVRYTLHFGGRGLGRADAQLAKKLARVGRQNLGTQLLSEGHGKGGFAHGSRASHGKQHRARVGGGGR